MPRPQRIEYPGAWYYVVNEAASDVSLFQDANDYSQFIDLLAEASRIFSMEIHAYSLLEQETHLLIHTPKGELSRAMRHVNGVYTQRYKKRWDHEGALFSSRYRAILIDPKEYLVPLVTYIHSRPVLLRETLRSLDHQWTSHRAYLKENERPLWLHTEAVLRQLGGFIRALGVARLHSMVNRGPSEKIINDLKRTVVVLGDEDFVKSIKRKRTIVKQTKSPVDPQQKQERVKCAKEILDFVSEVYHVPASEIKKSLSGVQNEARNMAVYQMRSVAGMSQKEIAKHLKVNNPYTVAKVLERFQTKMKKDPELESLSQNITLQIEERIRQ